MASEKNVGPNFRDEKSAANFPVEPAMVRKLVRLRLGGFPLRLEVVVVAEKNGVIGWLVGWLFGWLVGWLVGCCWLICDLDFFRSMFHLKALRAHTGANEDRHPGDFVAPVHQQHLGKE